MKRNLIPIKIFSLIFLLTQTAIPGEAPPDDNPQIPQQLHMNNITNNHIQIIVSQEFFLKIKQNIEGFMRRASGSLGEALSMIVESAYENRFRIGLSAIFALYLYANYKLVVLRKQLDNNECWSLWLKNKTPTLESLLEIPQKELLDSLLKEVQRRYISPTNPSDFINPLIKFTQAIEKEKSKLQTYVTIYRWLKTFHVSWLSFASEGFMEECKERIKKLAYLKNIFTNWMAEYNLTRNGAFKD